MLKVCISCGGVAFPPAYLCKYQFAKNWKGAMCYGIGYESPLIMVEVSSLTTITEHDYGAAIGVLLGFPILIATPILAWIGGRDPETFLG